MHSGPCSASRGSHLTNRSVSPDAVKKTTPGTTATKTSPRPPPGTSRTKTATKTTTGKTAAAKKGASPIVAETAAPADNGAGLEKFTSEDVVIELTDKLAGETNGHHEPGSLGNGNGLQHPAEELA